MFGVKAQREELIRNLDKASAGPIPKHCGIMITFMYSDLNKSDIIVDPESLRSSISL